MFRKYVGIWGEVTGKSSSYFFHAGIHIVTFRAGVQFKTYCAAKVGVLTWACFPTAQIVESLFIKQNIPLKL